MHVTRIAAVAALLIISFAPSFARAHGFVGERFFPATILTDDPFVADEMSLPTATLNPKAADGSRESDVGFAEDLEQRLFLRRIQGKPAPAHVGEEALEDLLGGEGLPRRGEGPGGRWSDGHAHRCHLSDGAGCKGSASSLSEASRRTSRS